MSDLSSFLDLNSLISIPSTFAMPEAQRRPKMKNVRSTERIISDQRGASGNAIIKKGVSGTTGSLFTYEERMIKSQDMLRVRSALGLTQAEAALLLGVSLATIQKIEQGDSSDHRRAFKFRFFELISLMNFLKKRVASDLARRKIFGLPRQSLEGKSFLDIAETLPKDDRLYEISGLLRRQFG